MREQKNIAEGESKSKTLTSYSDDEISLVDIISRLKLWGRYLLSKWVFILIGLIVGSIIGIVYANHKKIIYKAELSFVLEDEKSGGMGAYAGIASQFGLELGMSGSGAFSSENLLELMRSRSLVEKALLKPVALRGKMQTLANYYIDFKEMRAEWQNNHQLSNLQFLPGIDRSTLTLKHDSILAIIYNSIIVKNLSVEKKDKKSSIIVVKVNSEDEIFSKVFTELLTKEVSDFYVDTKTKRSSQNLAILQHQTDSVRRILNAAISGVATSVDANPNINPALQILRAPSQRRQVDVQANLAILTELVKNLEISKMSLRKETPLIQIIDRPILPLKKQQISKTYALTIGAFVGLLLMSVFLVLRKVLIAIFKQTA